MGGGAAPATPISQLSGIFTQKAEVLEITQLSNVLHLVFINPGTMKTVGWDRANEGTVITLGATPGANNRTQIFQKLLLRLISDSSKLP